MMPGTGCLCFVSFSGLAGWQLKFYSYLPAREVYKIAWRAKRLMDRYGSIPPVSEQRQARAE